MPATLETQRADDSVNAVVGHILVRFTEGLKIIDPDIVLKDAGCHTASVAFLVGDMAITPSASMLCVDHILG